MMAHRPWHTRLAAALGWSAAMAGADPTRPPVTTSRERQAPARKQRAILPKTIAAVAVAFLLIAFGVANDSRVPVDYLVVTRESPLILVIGVSGLLGAIIGALVMRRAPGRSRGRSAKRAPGP
jgi:uncharacterized integral membrane protein